MSSGKTSGMKRTNDEFESDNTENDESDVKITRTIQDSDDDSESDMEELERQMLEPRHNHEDNSLSEDKEGEEEYEEEDEEDEEEDEEEKQIATEVEKIMKMREELLPKRVVTRLVENENPIVSIFLDISSHGSSSIFTNCKGKRTGFDPSTWNVVMLKPPQERGGKMKAVEEINGIVTHGRSEICSWTAKICNIPKKFPIYNINAPCCVGYGVPRKGTGCMIKGLCSPHAYTTFCNTLTAINILPNMVKLSNSFNDAVKLQKLRGHPCKEIIDSSLRINHQLAIPVLTMLNKEFQCQYKDNSLTSINLHLLLKNGENKKFCLLTSENKPGITIETGNFRVLLEKTISLVDLLEDEYSECRKACTTYKRKLTFVNKKIICGPVVETTLNDILQLIYCLIEHYGDNTDIYISDSSCWITNEYNYETHDASYEVKAVNAKLTTLLTEHNILHGGRTSYKTRKRRKTLRKKTKLRRKPIFKY